jgi:hypothetical protein
MGLGIGSGHGRGRIAEGGRIGFARGGESGALERLLEFVHEAVMAHDDPRVLSGQIREPIHRLTSFPEDLAKQQLGDVYKHYGLPYDPKGFSFLPDPPKLNYVEQRPQSVDDSVLTNPNTYGWYLMKMRGPESQVKPLLDKVRELGGNMSPEIYDQADFRYPSKEEHFRGGKV